MTKLRFAFAVNHADEFEEKHFGDADKYLIYELSLDSDKLNFVKEELNKFKLVDEKHGSTKKGLAITQFLKEQGVNVLVSRQFGINIKMVNNHFVPIIIFKEQPQEVLEIILKHIKWIQDEFIESKKEYKVFRINEGILKYSLTKQKVI